MLGISTYLADLDTEYLENAAEIGAKYVFTSLHIPEEDFSDIDQKLPLLLETCEKNGLLLVPDVSPVTFEKLGIAAGNMRELSKLGIKAVRLDYGFEDIEQLKQLQKDFYVLLNASVVDREFLTEAKKSGVDFTHLKVAHNFYPKTDTGLSEIYFSELNKKFIDFDLDILAFVPGDKLKRFPLYQGLPTIEKHRGRHPFVSAVELIYKFKITDVMIGDSLAELSTLKMIQEYMDNKVLTLPVCFDRSEDKKLYNQSFSVRKDMAEKVIRLVVPRIPKIAIGKTLMRNRGTITIENQLGGRYSGEIQICKEQLPFSPTTNVLGFIHPDFIDLIDYVDHDTTILFLPFDEL